MDSIVHVLLVIIVIFVQVILRITDWLFYPCEDYLRLGFASLQLILTNSLYRIERM